MLNEPTVAEGAYVNCAVCQRAIARSAALCTHAEDYTLYVCHECCHEDWSADRMAVHEQEAGGG